MRAVRWCFLAGLFLALSGAAAQEKAAPNKVDLKVVKYGEIGDIVRQQQGKVVFVDFWGTGCIPCRKAFPHLVEMQRQYGKDGLVVVSVCVDDLTETPEAKDEALKFLRSQNATFTNVLLDEKPEVWQEKLRFDAVPCVYLFDRQGKWRQFKGEEEYPKLDKLVPELLQQK
jgi:thiol-disulfide isomerase/thioredoxin